MKIIDRKVNPISLKFLKTDLETSFYEYYVKRYLWQLRLAHILGATSYLFAVLSEILFLNKSDLFLWLRIGIVIPSFIFGYVCTYVFSKFYERNYQYFNMFYVLITSLSFIYTGVSAPSSYANIFYTAIIIALIFNYAFIRQSFIKSSLVGFIILAVYYIMVFSSFGKPDYFLLNVYITIVHFLGMFIAYLTEYDNKRSYILMLLNQKSALELSNVNSILEKKVEERTLEIQKAKEVLEENEARLIDANKLAGLGYWIWDIESGEVSWSDEVYKIFGLSKETFTPKIDSIMKLSPWPEENRRHLELMARAKENRVKDEYEQKFLKSDGSIGYYRSTYIGIYNEHAKLKTIKGTVMDITTVKKYELNLINKYTEYEALNEELKKTNKELLIAKEKAEESNRLKTEFLQNMSHEIRTPMNGIMGFSEMLISPDITKEDLKEFSKIIQNSSFQLLRIIDDILEISTLETKQITLNEESLCLNELLKELSSVFNLKSQEHKIPIRVKKGLEDNESYIISDKAKIVKIISNLLENSLKFTNKGFIEIGYNLEKDKLVLYVKDTGIGVAPDNLEMIFNRFSQEDKELSSKKGGLGLGLSISKENAQLLGGDIHVRSEKGKGSTFFVTIPYKPDIAKNNDIAETISEKNTTSNNKLKVLIVEDEEINYLYLETLLKHKTNHVRSIFRAKNGKEAIDICKKNKDLDLVFMDIKMPVMDGYEATKKIKALYPDLPVIAQTAFSTDADKELALRHGCDDFISKPIDKNILLDMINRYAEVV